MCVGLHVCVCVCLAYPEGDIHTLHLLPGISQWLDYSCYFDTESCLHCDTHTCAHNLPSTSHHQPDNSIKIIVCTISIQRPRLIKPSQKRQRHVGLYKTLTSMTSQNIYNTDQ